MKRTWVTAATAALALISPAVAIAGTAQATPASAKVSRGAEVHYLVLTTKAAATKKVVASLRKLGHVTGSNRAVGLIQVTSDRSDFLAQARALPGVAEAAQNRSIGRSPQRVAQPNKVEREHLKASDRQARAKASAQAVSRARKGHRPAKQDPFDPLLWGMDMIQAPQAHAIDQGSKKVLVGIIDTGIDGKHLDLRANFNRKLSRNFTTDIPAIDGPCEVASCQDPADVDEGGHGSHVAGTIGAAMNGIGVSGVAPKVSLVNIRGGQDSGYFFLAPVVDALTYAGDVGLDVVNMSFYVDPWLYNCKGGADVPVVDDAGNPVLDESGNPTYTKESDEAIAQQELIIDAMTRALRYAHGKRVTLVAALGNDHDNLSAPRNDFSSPDYDDPSNDGGNNYDAAPYERKIDNSRCFDLPTEGPYVIGVSAVGPSKTKSDFSNWVSDLNSRELEVAAPGGWFRDFVGTPRYRTNENLILSTVPLVSVQETGEVDANGDITALGQSSGVKKECRDEVCSYYAWYQGTSMASPHASGVAALAVSRHGSRDRSGLTMSPNAVRGLLMGTAQDTACPAGGVRSYAAEGRPASFTAQCAGTDDFNGFYGDGIVSALGVVE